MCQTAVLASQPSRLHDWNWDFITPVTRGIAAFFPNRNLLAPVRSCFQSCFQQESIKEGGPHVIYRPGPRGKDGSHGGKVQRAPPAGSLLFQSHLLIYLNGEVTGMKATGNFNKEWVVWHSKTRYPGVVLAGHTVASLYLPHPRQRTFLSSFWSLLIPFVRCPANRNPSLPCACPLMSSPTMPPQTVPSVSERVSLRRTEGTTVLSFVGLRSNLLDRQA